MRTLIHILFFFLLTTQICFGQWYAQNSGTTANLNAVHFIDANTGWAVGDSGKILHTTNAGQEWTNQVSGTLESLNDIIFYDTNKGTIVGDAGAILRTTNAGMNWVQITVGVICPLWSVSFVDDYIGWISGSFLGQYCSNGIVLKTTDGGNIWNIIDTLGYSYIHFIDDLIGWRIKMELFAAEQLQKTTDGGINWITKVQSRDVAKICFLNENIGWVSYWEAGVYGGPRIIKTIDGGVNWILQDSTIWAYDLFFVDQNNGWAIDNYDYVKIKYSSDGGSSWSVQLDTFQHTLSAIYFTDSNNGWVVGAGGTILHTTNGGVTFIANEITQPTEFILELNYPNPFNPSTTISWQSPVGSHQAIKVYDVLGNEIAALVDEYKPAGKYEFEFDGSRLASGVYFYKIQAGEFVAVKKMILIK